MKQRVRSIMVELLGGKVILIALSTLALMGLLAACGSDEPAAKPATSTDTAQEAADDSGTADSSTSAASDSTTATDSAAEDSGETADATATAAEEFFSNDHEFLISSDRFYSWFPVTVKRIVEEHLPNVQLTINNVRLNELLVDFERRPEKRAVYMEQHSPKIWDGWRAGNTVLPSNIPTQTVAPQPVGWGIYPYSQMQIWTTDASGIDSVKDLDGKVLNMGRNPEDLNTIVYREWFDTVGAKPRQLITTEHGPSGMLEGNYDAATSGIVFQLTTSGDYIPLQTAKRIRMIDFTAESIDKMAAAHPEWNFMQKIVLCSSAMSSAMNLDYPVINPDYVGSGSFPGENCNLAPGGHSVNYGVWPEFDQEAVYQMTKVLVENMDDLSLMYPGAPWAGKVYAARWAHTTEAQEFFAPGAARAFEELGMTYGEEGTQEWYGQRTDSQRWWLDFID